MGIPGLARWLEENYRDITSDITPNSSIKCDNLYLDMNDFIHSSIDRYIPETANDSNEKIQQAIIRSVLDCIDEVFSIVRPRELVYIVLDGVVPRDKMYHQRWNHFVHAQNSLNKTVYLSTCDVKPGTVFMSKLADNLRSYIYDRMNTDSHWRPLQVILSDSNVPGEGEHKIMHFIRAQSVQHSDIRHVIFCNDSDLILLGLIAHLDSFKLIRNKRESDKYELMDLQVLRENIKHSITDNKSEFQWDVKRVIDDWVFICFLCGTALLPNLPSINFFENSMDDLMNVYKEQILRCNGYLTENGKPVIKHLETLLTSFGKNEEEIFKEQHKIDQERRNRTQLKDNQTSIQPSKRSVDISEIKKAAAMPVPLRFGPPTRIAQSASSNTNSTVRQTQSLTTQSINSRVSVSSTSRPTDQRYGQMKEETPKLLENNREEQNHSNEVENNDPNDTVQLWKKGWHERYYKEKFSSVQHADMEQVRIQVVTDYVRALHWILQYFYQGVPSWDWYYPYHYAPFASDFLNLADITVSFNTKSEPLTPIEQMMISFPLLYKTRLPSEWQTLLSNDEQIAKYYPTDFTVDLLGRLNERLAIVILPFVDENLLEKIKSILQTLSEEEQRRNRLDFDRLFVHPTNSCYALLKELYSKRNRATNDNPRKIPEDFIGVRNGQIWPGNDQTFIDIDENNKVLSANIIIS